MKKLPISLSAFPEIANGAVQLIVISLAISKLSVNSFAWLQVLLGWQSIAISVINGGMPTIYENKWVRSDINDRKKLYIRSLVECLRNGFVISPIIWIGSYFYWENYNISTLITLSGIVCAATPTWMFTSERLYQFTLIFNLIPRALMIPSIIFWENSSSIVEIVFLSLTIGQLLIFIISTHLGNKINSINLSSIFNEIKENKEYKTKKSTSIWQRLATIFNLIFRSAFIVLLDIFATNTMVAFYAIVDKIARAYQGILNSYLGSLINIHTSNSKKVPRFKLIRDITTSSIFLIISGSIAAIVIDKKNIFDFSIFLSGFAIWSISVFFGSLSFSQLKIHVFGFNKEIIFFKASFSAAIAACISLPFLMLKLPIYCSVIPVAISEVVQFYIIWISTKNNEPNK